MLMRVFEDLYKDMIHLDACNVSCGETYGRKKEDKERKIRIFIKLREIRWGRILIEKKCFW